MAMSTVKIRQKRTLQYFFVGLFGVVNNKRNNVPNSRASNDHKISPLATLVHFPRNQERLMHWMIMQRIPQI